MSTQQTAWHFLTRWLMIDYILCRSFDLSIYLFTHTYLYRYIYQSIKMIECLQITRFFFKKIVDSQSYIHLSIYILVYTNLTISQMIGCLPLRTAWPSLSCWTRWRGPSTGTHPPCIQVRVNGQVQCCRSRSIRIHFIWPASLQETWIWIRIKKQNFWFFEIWSDSGSDPLFPEVDLDPDPHQNEVDPQHWSSVSENPSH